VKSEWIGLDRLVVLGESTFIQLPILCWIMDGQPTGEHRLIIGLNVITTLQCKSLLSLCLNSCWKRCMSYSGLHNAEPDVNTLQYIPIMMKHISVRKLTVLPPL